MELSAMSKEKKNLTAIEKPAAKPHGDTDQVPPYCEVDKKVTLRRFNPDVRITEEMIWQPLDRPKTREVHNHACQTGPTWSHIFWQITAGIIEILIPLAFIVGMIYWRAPWLFWAVVRFLSGEPIFHF